MEIKFLYIVLIVFLLVVSCGSEQKYQFDTPNSTIDKCAPYGIDIGGVCVPKENVVKQVNNTLPIVENKSIPIIKENNTIVTTQKSIPVKTESKQVLDFNEGDLVSLGLNVTDPDKDSLVITYSKPLDSFGKWQTKAGDSGEYPVTIKVSDGKVTVQKDILIRVLSKNHPPVIDIVSTFVVEEGDTITLSPKVNDPDGDNFTIKYSGFMTSNTFKTGYQDAGKYDVKITATDSKGSSSSKDITVSVLDMNRPPVIESITVK